MEFSPRWKNYRTSKSRVEARKEQCAMLNAKLPVADRDHIQGLVDAPFSLVEYGDYECPYCGQAYPIVAAIQKRLGDRLCFVFRNFPLSNMHPHATHAAEAAEAAG